MTGWAANRLFGGTDAHPNYGVVFATAGVGMVIGLIWFGFGRRLLLGAGAPPAHRKGFGSVGLVTAAGLLMVPILCVLLSKNEILDYILWALLIGCCAMLLRAGLKSDRVQLDKIVAMLILFVANILFWMFFEQAGSSFSFLADHVVNRNIGGWEFPIGWFQSINAAAIVVLAPIMTIAWSFLDRRKMEPSIPRKFGLGLIWNALGFMVLVWALRSMVDSSHHIPLWPLALCYVVQTLGELSLSPIGLSMVTKLAPPEMVGATMGAWFMSIALGNKMAGNLAARISGETGMTVDSALRGFNFSFWLLIGAGVVVLAISPRINKLMHGVK